MGWQPGPGDEADSIRLAAVPDWSDPVSGRNARDGAGGARDPRLAAFTPVDGRYVPVPSAALALLADQVCGPERRCPGATGGELVGLLKAWAAQESWAASAKLGVIAEMIRRDQAPPGTTRPGDLPDGWSASLRHELAAALACSAQSADTAAWLAWEQQTRLPGTGALLGDGTLTYGKARAVTETFRYLTDADAAAAEAMIAGQLAGKTYPQVLRLAEQAALTVDPELAARRREQAQKKDARVSLFREQQGTAGLAGRDLPPDEALAAMASVNARAQEYEDSGAFGDTRMDVLRAFAYLDLLNGVPAGTRIAAAEPGDEAADAAAELAWARARAARAARAAGDHGEPDPPADDTTGPGHRTNGNGNDEPEEGGGAVDPDSPLGPIGGGPGQGSGGPSPGSGPSPAGGALRARPPDLAVPLATLLGLTGRPGEIQGLGMLDPALARQLAAAAAASPHTSICLTVTSPEGFAIGHGCARLSRVPGPELTPGDPLGRPAGVLGGFPARLNLTIAATALPGLASPSGHPGPGAWALAQSGGTDPPGRVRSPGEERPPTGTSPPDGTGPPGGTARSGTDGLAGYGNWILTTPGGRHLAVRLDPVPTHDCDHRQETGAYQPGDKLRHLVQIRDGRCTFPTCNRHARESDFEHAQPYDKGGRTCACNAGARSRSCHRVKQSPGWKVTQPKPGWHQWQTPAGLIYVQEPWRYPT
jgi:hypothetical protein